LDKTNSHFQLKQIVQLEWLTVFSFIMVLTAGCTLRTDNTRFESIPPGDSNITFENPVEETDAFNFSNFMYMYDGGGVSIGDINNDSLPDIFLTANQGVNRLYLNKGELVFEEITRKAGVGGNGDWTTGTTMADVNGDGLLDLYVCNMEHMNQQGSNELYINNGDLTFTEKAGEYGLDYRGLSKHATFFDYDNDGDLDLYLLTMSVHREGSFSEAERRKKTDPTLGDRLFRNDNGSFTDVTEESGIYSSILGYGLGVAASDLNLDGCLDLYISNDFHENDYLYLNNCDGTFKEVISRATGHTSRASMGNDVGDINNDARPDIMVLDMLPHREAVRKTTVSSEPVKAYEVQREFGYHPQLIRNTLQLNLGTAENRIPVFAEIAPLAGVEATDWSWSSLFMDVNNDGWKDLFVSNGIYRRPNYMDYLARVSGGVRSMSDTGQTEQRFSDIMPPGDVKNFGFVNNGNLTFTDRSEDLGLHNQGFSNGAAYGDLDNDGDLDLVVNNVNAPASLYQNRTSGSQGSNFLNIRLKGKSPNTFGIGAKIKIKTDSVDVYLEQVLSRGFQSSVSPVLHAGLGSAETVDSLTVVWPDQSYEVLTGVSANQTMILEQENASGSFNYDRFVDTGSTPVFEKSPQVLENYRHEEDKYSEFDVELLIPHLLSREGPGLAVADVNGDGLDDLYVGGGKWQPGTIFIQKSDGSWLTTLENKQVFEQDRRYEDVEAEFFDANGDGHPDLYVVSGGNETAGSRFLEDRLYFNDGNGNFIRFPDALPPIYENGACVKPHDIDGDGDLDLFLGNRSIPRNYGASPKSYLLENDGTGHFNPIRGLERSPLNRVGMVTDAVWADVTGNGTKELVVAGEWMPIRILAVDEERLDDITRESGLADSNGWWFSIRAGDMDGDGDQDLVAGNVGRNSIFKPSKSSPLKLFLGDFDGNGRNDPIITRSIDGSDYPVVSRDEFFTHFRSFRSDFPTYEDFAGKPITEVLPADKFDNARMKVVYTFDSVYLENRGDGSFNSQPLPVNAQLSPIRAIQIDDFNSDGYRDILLAGNFYPVKPSFGGQYDAGYGWLLTGDGQGNFNVLNHNESGFFVRGQVVEMEKIRLTTGLSIITGINNDSLEVFIPSD